MSVPRHIPVLLGPVLAALAPLSGAHAIDGTFGAGGYAAAILDAGAERLVAIDRDPSAIAGGAALAQALGGRLILVEAPFATLDEAAAEHLPGGTADAVVLDIGVSSMQLDQAERGFSFRLDGPLDMRMGEDGPSAREVVNHAPEGLIADILFQFGEERASRRIARAIVAARAEAEIATTGRLAEIVAGCLPRPRPGQPHAATRSFQALRIAVNDELGQLAVALAAAERVLRPGGRLGVVTFHSLEDRVVKRYLQSASGMAGGASRHQPERAGPAPRFERPAKPVVPDEAEIAANPRARSARLRAAIRTAAAPVSLAPDQLGLPALARGDGVHGRSAWGARS